MNQRFFSSFLAVSMLCGGASFFAGCKQATGQSGGTAEIAAKVNSVAIPLSKVDRQIEQGLKQNNLKLADLSPIELAAARLQALDRLVNNEILVQRAQREQIQVSEEDINQAVKRFLSAQGLTEEKFQKELKDAGLTEDEFRGEQRQTLLVSKLYEKLKGKIPLPSEKEIEDFFNQNREQFKIGRGVYLSQIVVDPGNNNLKNDAVGEEQAKQKIAQVSTRLKAGDDFATVARTVSEDIQTAQQSGDMGLIPEEALQQVYGETLAKRFFAMREGEITEPITGSNGRMYIFKVAGKRLEAQEGKLEDPEVRKQIVDGLRQQREQILTAALQFAATNEARVENYLSQRILDNPANFGSVRPAGAAPRTEGAKPAETKPSEEKKADAKPSEPAKDAEKPAEKKN